jgi:hypothetical protein
MSHTVAADKCSDSAQATLFRNCVMRMNLPSSEYAMGACTNNCHVFLWCESVSELHFMIWGPFYPSDRTAQSVWRLATGWTNEVLEFESL